MQQGFFAPFPTEPTEAQRRNIAKAGEIVREAVDAALEGLAACEDTEALQRFIAVNIPDRGIDLIGHDGQPSDPADVLAALRRLNQPPDSP